jgi:hypothetical protein
VIVGILSLFFCSSVIIQISFAEEIELKSVGRGCFVSRWARNKKCENKFFVSSDKGTSFAEWNIDHEKFGSAGGIITGIQASAESFSLKGFEAFDSICDNETPSDIKLSGHCGQGIVKLVSDNGNKGAFTSNVKCG